MPFKNLKWIYEDAEIVLYHDAFHSILDLSNLRPKFCTLPGPITMCSNPKPFAIVLFVAIESEERVAAIRLLYYYEYILLLFLLSEIPPECNSQSTIPSLQKRGALLYAPIGEEVLCSDFYFFYALHYCTQE